MDIDFSKTFYTWDRLEWREWLAENFGKDVES